MSGPFAENDFSDIYPVEMPVGLRIGCFRCLGRLKYSFLGLGKHIGLLPPPRRTSTVGGLPRGGPGVFGGQPGMACLQGPAQPEGLRCGLLNGSDPMVGKGLALFSLAGGHVRPEAVSWYKKWGLGSQKQRAPAAGRAIFRVRTWCGRRKGLRRWVFCLFCLKRSNVSDLQNAVRDKTANPGNLSSGVRNETLPGPLPGHQLCPLEVTLSSHVCFSLCALSPCNFLPEGVTQERFFPFPKDQVLRPGDFSCVVLEAPGPQGARQDGPSRVRGPGSGCSPACLTRVNSVPSLSRRLLPHPDTRGRSWPIPRAARRMARSSSPHPPSSSKYRGLLLWCTLGHSSSGRQRRGTAPTLSLGHTGLVPPPWRDRQSRLREQTALDSFPKIKKQKKGVSSQAV